MKDETNPHFFLYELALREGMSVKTLSGRLRTLGYTGSLRGLLRPELATHFRQLLHPYELPIILPPGIPEKKERKRTESVLKTYSLNLILVE
ncbi:MAG: hypothetical protein WBP00_01010 [Saprospiraceae bacterium]